MKNQALQPAIFASSRGSLLASKLEIYQSLTQFVTKLWIRNSKPCKENWTFKQRRLAHQIVFGNKAKNASAKNVNRKRSHNAVCEYMYACHIPKRKKTLLRNGCIPATPYIICINILYNETSTLITLYDLQSGEHISCNFVSWPRTARRPFEDWQLSE